MFLKNFAEFTWKHLRAVPQVKRNSIASAFLWICEIFKNPFLQNTSGRLVLNFFHSLGCFFATRLTNRNQVFSIFECLSRLSNVMNIMNDSLYFAKQTTQLLQQGNSCCCRYFSETPEINLHWISVLQYPVILHLKSQKQLWMRYTDSEVFFKQAVLKHFAILTSVFNKFSGL